jgi:propanol-preferring alcohol dehydrogenase
VHASFSEATQASVAPPKAIIDFVGSKETLSSAVARIQTGGRLELVGVEGRLDVPARSLVERELTVSGSLVGTFAELLELTELVAAGRLEVVTTKYPLDHVASALTDLREGRVLGRAVLVP